MNLFIDTNHLLDFFRMSAADLEELRKVSKLVTNSKIKLWISHVVKDEFYRNRETVIAEALKQFQKSNCELHRPNIVRTHGESVELESIQTRFRALLKVVSDRVAVEGAHLTTVADFVIKELFAAASVIPVDETIITRGLRRTAIGKPPGKKDSCGDAIHWEWLLQVIPSKEDLHLVSRDGDFESDLTPTVLTQYLEEEWKAAKDSICTLHTSLAVFLKGHFPDIRLAGEVDKAVAIEKLERSPNFTTTHNAIERLLEIDDFTKDELRRLIRAFQSNSQIRWILGDADVSQFAEKIVTLAHENGLEEEVYQVDRMLEDLDDSESSSSGGEK